MTEIQNKEGFRLFCKALAGTDRDWKNARERYGYDISGHPLDKESKSMFFVWFGNASNDWLDLVKKAFGPAIESIDLSQLEIIFWLAPVENNTKNQNQIWLEIKDASMAFLCSGMTDYSGEGNSAYNDTILCFEFVQSIGFSAPRTKKVAWEIMNEGWIRVANEVARIYST